MSEFSSFDPATGSPVWTGDAAGSAEVAAAVAAARSAFAAWSRAPLADREQVLRRFAAVLAERKEEFASALGREVGKPHWEALTEVQSMIGKVEISIRAQAERRATFTSGRAVTRFRPHGVVAVLGPFNFPGHLPNGHIVPALLAGNTVVFKPSEFAPAVAELTAAAWREAGLPPGVLTLVQGGQPTGAALAGHPAIDGLFFTGSPRAGLALARSLAERPGTILALEMGGNNPLVVWEAADVGAAALLAVQSAYQTAGQRCTCARRLIVPAGGAGEALLAEVASCLAGLRVGPPDLRPEPFMGPVISREAAHAVLRAQEAWLAAGGVALRRAESLRAGTGLLSPGLIDVTAIPERADQEVFGPLLQVIRVPDFEAAIAEANATRFGLAAGLLSDSAALFERFRDKIRAGIVNWNQPLTGASSEAPFGGVGESGNHRPSAYFAADYCSYPVAGIEMAELKAPRELPIGLSRTRPSFTAAS